jgi:hypothetical protein
MGLAPKCHFVPGLPSGSLEILEIGTPALLEAYNFVCRPPNEIRSKEKVVALIESFPTVCHMSPTRKEIRVNPNFL